VRRAGGAERITQYILAHLRKTRQQSRDG
jgi:hypothetical protein